MYHTILALLWLVSFSGKGFAICGEGAYLNLCGYCVGGSSNKSDFEGLDQCGICNGLGTCIGCDGNVNSPLKLDKCGLCLTPEAENWNDCRKIDGVYPAVLDLTTGDTLVSLTLAGTGLKRSDENSTECLILPLEAQADGPILQDIILEANQIEMKVLLSNSTGKFRIECSDIEGFAEFLVVISSGLNVVLVEPPEIAVGTEVELKLEIEEDKSGNTNGSYWCFARQPGRETLTFPAVAVSENNISCSGYTPTASGRVQIGVVPIEDAADDEEKTGNTAEIIVRGTPPKCIAAEYSPDMRSITVAFDQNIQVFNCSDAFSPTTTKSLGDEFFCEAVGGDLHVMLGENTLMMDTLEIMGNSSVRSAGTADLELTLPVDCGTISVSKAKVIPPNFSLAVPSAVCQDQENVHLKVSKLGGQKLSYTWVVTPVKVHRGKSQRENLLMWKKMRAVEAAMNNKSANHGALLSRTELLPGFDYIISLRAENLLKDDREVTSLITVMREGGISVTVTTPPSFFSITAEAGVTVCNETLKNQILRYKWMLDGRTLPEDGQFLQLRNAHPGIYNISCHVMKYETEEVLGMGWALAQVLHPAARAVISPVEVVLGTMDDVVLQADSTSGVVKWTCQVPEGEPCLSVGPGGRRVVEVVNVTSEVLRVPAGVLAVGSYIWSLENHPEAVSKVIISPGVPPRLKVAYQTSVDLSKPVFINADVERLTEGCRIRWRSIDKNGYNYFDLQEDVGLGDLIRIKIDDFVVSEREAPLTIPTATEKWKGLTRGGVYLLRLEAECPEPIPSAHVDVSFTVNAPPGTSGVVINPETGEALREKFTVRIPEGQDCVEDYPLTYKLSFSNGSSEEIPIAKSVSPEFQVWLPSGNITVIVRVCDVREACSTAKKNVNVLPPSAISSGLVKDLQFQIRNRMLSGDRTGAFGLAITSFMTLSTRAEFKKETENISSTAGEALRERLKDLSGRSVKDHKRAFEFLEQAVNSLKYFPESSGIVKDLTHFKKKILSRPKRFKRTADGSLNGGLEENLIEAIFRLHARNVEVEDSFGNRMEVVKDVERYLVDLCSYELRGDYLIDSPIVSIRIFKLTPDHAKKSLAIGKDEEATVSVRKEVIKPKTCLATVKYSRNLMEVSENDSSSSNLYEVRIFRNGYPVSGTIAVHLPIPGRSEKAECVSLSGLKCEVISQSQTGISCKCGLGIISLVQNLEGENLAGILDNTTRAVAKEATPGMEAGSLTDGREVGGILSSYEEFNAGENFAGRKVNQVREVRDAAAAETDGELKETTVKAILDLHAKNLEQNDTKSGREELLNDVRKYMIDLCGALLEAARDPVVIESSLVVLKVMKLTQNEMKKDFLMSEDAVSSLRFNFKSAPRKTCLVVAKYKEDLLDNTTLNRISDVFEIRLIQNGTFKDNFREDIKSMVVTIPIRDPGGDVDCQGWSPDNGWSSKCGLKARTNVSVSCSCKDQGVFAVFSVKPATKELTAPATKTPPPPMTSTTVNTTPRLTTVSPNTTAETATTAISDTSIITAVIQNISNLIGKNASSYVSGTFRIEEEYDKMVGSDVTAFKQSLRQQIAEQLQIPESAIANLILKPSDVTVTVLFVDVEDARAEVAIKELVTKLHDGSFRLKGPNSTALKVPQQDVKVKIGPLSPRSTMKVRLITYGVVAATLLAIFLGAIAATYFKRKQARIPMTLPHLSIDEHPSYRQFHNEFSLDGSSSSLARYRRDHSFETETPQ